MIERVHRLFVVSSPSGGGKTTLVRQMLDLVPGLAYSVSSTTRPMRPGEKHGVDYFFLSIEEFKRKIEQDEFLEHALVHGHYYGTDRHLIESLLARGQDVILDVDVAGAAQIRHVRPSAVLMFVVPPSRRVLEERLRRRHSDPPEVIARRLRNAAAELRRIPDYDYLIVNDDLQQAIEEMAAVIRAERNRISYLDPAGLDRFWEE